MKEKYIFLFWWLVKHILDLLIFFFYNVTCPVIKKNTFSPQVQVQMRSEMDSATLC